MANEERTGKRFLDYSGWHRTLPSKLFATDIDWVEYRRGREAVALIETKLSDAPFPRSQRTVMTDLANRASLPFYLVRYHYVDESAYDSWSFFVVPMNGHALAEDGPITFNQWIPATDYIRFLEQL